MTAKTVRSTSKPARSVRDTGSKARRLDPDEMARALGAEKTSAGRGRITSTRLEEIERDGQQPDARFVTDDELRELVRGYRLYAAIAVILRLDVGPSTATLQG